MAEGKKDDSALPALDRGEMFRYSRHILIPQVGIEGQKKLKKSRVLLVGAGGLGSPAALYLAAAGVGLIGLVDHDRVEASNLQRQIIHGEGDIGRLKTASAKDGILRINSGVSVVTFDVTLSSANALDIFSRFDIIVDGSDNFPARYLINDACALLGKPDVYGAVYRFEGQATVFDAVKGGCLRCLFSSPPAPGMVPSCGEGGVFGVLPGIVGTIQAAEVIKLILNGEAPLINRLLAFDAWDMRFHEFALRKKADCPLCGEQPNIKELIDYEWFCGSHTEDARAGEDTVEEISPQELKNFLDHGSDMQVIDVRLPAELSISRLSFAMPITLHELYTRMDELDPQRDVVVVCKKGEKSALAIQGLREAGYPGRLLSLKGGVNAWAAEIDPGMPVY